MQVYGYVRVSTEEQAREGVSLAAQEAKIQAYCVVKDWGLVEIIRDEGQSAKDLKRPGITRLLGLVEARQVGAVVVYKLDRLTRRVRDLDNLVELFHHKAVALVSLQESLDATTATGRLMMNLLASVAQFEREAIGERTSVAMQHLKALGLPYCKAVFTDPAVLAWMRELRAAGLSYQATADALNAAGIPPPARRPLAPERHPPDSAQDGHRGRQEDCLDEGRRAVIHPEGRGRTPGRQPLHRHRLAAARLAQGQQIRQELAGPGV